MLWNYRARDLSFRNADNPPRNLRCALLLISRRSDHLPYPARLCDFECERWVARARACFGLLFAPSQTCQICSTTRGAVSGLLEKTCRRMAFGARPSACLPPSAMPSEGSLRSPACSLYVHIVPLLSRSIETSRYGRSDRHHGEDKPGERRPRRGVALLYTTRARARGRATKPLEVLRALWSPTLHAQRAGAVGRCNPCPFSIQPQVTQPIPALPVRKGLWPWPTRKDRRHPESNRQRFPYEPRVIGGKLLMPAELQAIRARNARPRKRLRGNRSQACGSMSLRLAVSMRA